MEQNKYLNNTTRWFDLIHQVRRTEVKVDELTSQENKL